MAITLSIGQELRDLPSFPPYAILTLLRVLGVSNTFDLVLFSSTRSFKDNVTSKTKVKVSEDYRVWIRNSLKVRDRV